MAISSSSLIFSSSTLDGTDETVGAELMGFDLFAVVV